MSKPEMAYWAKSGYEIQISNMIRACWERGIAIFRGEGSLYSYRRAVELLIHVLPTDVKNAVKAFQRQLEEKYSSEIKHNYNPLNPLYSNHMKRNFEVAKIDELFSYIIDMCDQAGLLVKAQRPVKARIVLIPEMMKGNQLSTDKSKVEPS